MGRGLPPRLKAVLEGRLARLPSPARVVLESAAILGREFDFDLLRKVSELDEGVTVNALDELWRLRMIRERDRHYDFSHDKLREATLAGISPIRLRWLHQRVGETLEREQGIIEYPRIADHFKRAGLQKKASEYYGYAAQQAQQLFAFTEALEHLQHALLLETKPEVLANLHESRGEVLKMLDKREDAFQAFTQAYELSGNALQRARLNRNQTTLKGRFESETAREKYHSALVELRHAQDDPGYWAEWVDLQIAWIEVCYWRQDSTTIDQLMEQIKQPVEQYGTVLQKIKYRYRMFSSALVNERYLLNQAHVLMSQETMTLAIEYGDSYQISNAKRQLAMTAMFAGQFDFAEAAFHETIALCKKNKDMNSMLIARVYLAYTHRRQQKPQDVSTDIDLLEQILGLVSEHPAYRGVINANRAWLAWLKNDYLQTKHLARVAMEIWQSQVNPYITYWMVLFPLLDIAVGEKEADEALAHVQALLSPFQQRLEPEVESALLAVLEVDPTNKELFLARCRKAVDVAKEAGYL